MKNNKFFGIALLVLGVVLVVFGLNATESPFEQVSEALTGRYSDQTMWYLIGGALSVIVGLFLLLKK